MTLYYERRPEFWAHQFNGPEDISAFEESQCLPDVVYTKGQIQLNYENRLKREPIVVKTGQFLVEIGGNLNMLVLDADEFRGRFEPVTGP